MKSPLLKISLYASLGALIIGALAVSFAVKPHFVFREQPVIKVGVLHSLTGTMAISERSVVDATLLALEEVNQRGGVIGMKIEPVVADGKSDPEVFEQEAERLITKEHVKVIFGCWTSASRKAVKSVVEKYNSLLFYPVQYEGLECSPNIVYMGAAPNQQLIPAVTWACRHLGKRFFLVGSDYVFPRVANEIAKDVLGYIGGEVVGEKYMLLGSRDFTEIAKQIKETQPDVVLNTINGDSNLAFFAALREAAINSNKTKIISLSITENEIKEFREQFKKSNPQKDQDIIKEYLAGTYACWNYFETLDNPINAQFIRKIRSKYGQEYRVTDPMEAAYIGVYLWSRAIDDPSDFRNPKYVLDTLYHLSTPAPEGIITVARNNHARKNVRIAKVNTAGEFEVVWALKNPVEPEPYPYFRDRGYWNNLLEGLFRQWHGHWSAGMKPAITEEAK